MLMKFSRLLVLSALWLVGLGANAADLIERVAPTEPGDQPSFLDGTLTVEDNVVAQPADFEVGKLYVLYLKDKDLYFSQGCSWSTQASADVTPFVVRFTLPSGKTLADAALEFNDWNLYTKKWNLAFFDSATGMFTDRGSQANYFWQVIDLGNKTYRLQASEANPDLKPSTNPGFVGLDDATAQGGDTHGRGIGEEAYALSPFLAEGEGHHIDWYFYALQGDVVAAWQQYFVDNDIFTVAKKLKAAIETAEVDTEVLSVIQNELNAAIAAYNNESATVDELTVALNNLVNARNAAHENALGGATASNPKDATAFIENPTFEDASYTGWSGTAPNMTGSGSHGPANVAEHYNKNFDTYQVLSGLPKGVYALKNKGFFRGSYDDYLANANKVAYLYAKADDQTFETGMANPWEAQNTEAMAGATEFGTTASESSQAANGVTYYTPNDPSAARLYFEKGFYDNTTFFSLEGEGNIQIGVKKDSTVTNSDWVVFDTFGLTYYGGATDAYQLWFDSAKESFEGMTVSKCYIEAYEAAFNKTVTNRDEVLAALAAAAPLKDSVKLNITKWQELAKVIKEGQEIIADDNYPEEAKYDLGDYIEFTYFEELLPALELTNAEIDAEIAKVKEMIEATKEFIMPGTDVTAQFVKDADFSNGRGAWIQGAGGCNFRESIAEAYDTNFDLYQEVSGVKKGVYELQLQGFFRMQRDADAYTLYQNGEQKTNAGVYINNNKTSLMCIFEQGVEPGSELDENKGSGWYQNGTNAGDDRWFPNDMTSASKAFSFTDDDGKRSWYVNKAYGLVVNDGETLKIGVGGDVRGANWICFDNFRLIYQGYSADVVKPVLEDALNNLPSTTEIMTKTTFDKFQKAVEDAQNALASGDGEDMFNALVVIYGLTEEVNNSIAICKALNDKLEALALDIANAVNPAYEGEAFALIQEVQDKLQNKELEDSEIEGYEIKIKTVRTKLMLDPNYATATAEVPVDVTPVIMNPGFEKEGANVIDGWNAEGYNFGNDETQKAALLIEFYDKTFDAYQEILGLPAGFYQIAADAFCRVGSIDNDFKLFAENPASTEAYLYGFGGGEKTDSINVFALAKGAVTDDPGISGETTYTDANQVIYYIPNDMVSANAFFADGTYRQSVVTKVVEGQPLRLGIRKTKNTSTGWVIMDNFSLKYLGANAISDDVYTGIAAAKDQAAKTVNVELFTIDGRSVNSLQKGITIQKITKADGSVIVKKVRK